MNRHVLFILGAGSSKAAGVPVMEDFIGTGNDLLNAMPDGDPDIFHFKRFKDIQDAIIDIHIWASSDVSNIEALLYACEVPMLCNQFLGKPIVADNTPFDMSISRFVTRTIQESALLKPGSNKANKADALPPKTYKGFTDMLEELWQANPGLEVTIICLNYDLLLDYSLYFAGIDVCYDPDNPIPKSRGRISGKPGVRSSPKTVNLLKLHGSLNWGHCGNADHLMTFFTPEEYTWATNSSHDNWTLVYPAVKFLCNGKCKAAEAPVLLPPKSNKYSNINQLTSIWKRAARAISETNHVVIIGYSMPSTDSIFASLNILGGHGTRSANVRLLAVSPDFKAKGAKSMTEADTKDEKSPLERRYLSLLGHGYTKRGYFYKGKFGDPQTNAYIRQFICPDSS